mmetsp:Transcript_7360/g.16679  ORF Transcript_7360/g.16679 Transcript_7360/m.16679 type:complete len:289 (-) Transcript_7360:1752-2618(-)
MQYMNIYVLSDALRPLNKRLFIDCFVAPCDFSASVHIAKGLSLGVAHATSTPNSPSCSNDIQRVLLPLEFFSACIGFQTFLGIFDFLELLDNESFSFFFTIGCPILLTIGRTFTLLLLFESGIAKPSALLAARSASSSSHSLMHQDSAQDIHVRATRFLRPRRTLSSMVDMDAERENDESEDAVEAAGCGLVEPSSISIRMESPWGEDEDDDEGGGTASALLVLRTFSGLLLLDGVMVLPCFSRIMCRMETVDGALDSSKDGMCFIFNDPREVQDRTSSCGLPFDFGR